MKKFKNFVIGGIQQKVFNLVLITALMLMAAYTIVIAVQTGRIAQIVDETNRQQKQSITEISRETMDAVVNSSLVQSVGMQAYIADDLFRDTAGVVQVIADYAEHLFADPGAYAQRRVQPPQQGQDGQITVQLLTEEGVDPTEPELARKLALMGNLGDLMLAEYAGANVDSCYVALPEGAMLLVDDHASSKFDDKGAVRSIPIRARPWYTEAAEAGSLIFTDVTTDVFTGETSIMCAMPIYHEGQLAAVIGADLFLGDMATAVKQASENGGMVLILNQSGHVIFSPQTEGIFRVQPAAEAQDLRQSDNTELAAFVTDALKIETGVRRVDVEGWSYYMVGTPIETVGWTLVSAVPQALLDRPTENMLAKYDGIQNEAVNKLLYSLGRARQTIFVLLGVVFVLGLSAALILAKQIVKPLEAITRRVRALGGNDLRFSMEPAFRTGDEIEVLAESFAMLSGKTLQYISEVERVTAEKERIGTELALATRIQADMLPNIFPAFPERSEFDIYASMDPAKEVGGDFYDFFLVDDDHLCMVIADVSGKGVPAALFMMASKIILANNAMLGKSPAQILTDSNAAICSNNREEMFVTVWLGILELSTGKLTAANAGHEYPVVKHPDGRFELLRDKHGFVVGGLDSAKYRQYELVLEPGSKLFVYTDGVPEATDAQQKLFGTEKMLDALNAAPDSAAQQCLQNVRRAVDSFVKDAEQFDDLTMLCLTYNGPDAASAEEKDGAQ